MKTLVLSQLEVRELLPMARCMDLVAGALRRLSAGGAVNPLRTATLMPDRRGLLGVMPGYLDEPAALGIKVISLFHDNHASPYDSHQGVVVLFDTEHGRPMVIMDASEVTGIRTAAASGVATRVLAREDAGDVAILGSGVQARTHLEAMAVARPLRRVRVFSPNPDHRRVFAERQSERHGIAVEAVDSAEAAVRGANIICTATYAREPVVRGEWIAPGAHINAAGACVPKARELDTAAVAGASHFVDCIESALNESGDFLIPRSEGVIGDDHIRGELGAVMNGTVAGRASGDEITLFNSLGVAVEDLVAANYVLSAARVNGVGTEVDLVGLRQAGD